MAVAPRTHAEVRSELERLYLNHAQSVVHAVAVETSSIDVAWDALQETFVAMYGRLAAGLELNQPEAYLIKAAKQKARRSRARSAKETPLADEASAIDQDVPRAAMVGASLIWDACRELKPTYRTAVLMHDVEDLSDQEIGERLGTSRFSAAKLVQRGRSEMLARLVELVGRRRGCPADCAGRAATIWHLISGDLDFEARERLQLHMLGCEYCRQTEDELRQARTIGVLPLLIPLMEVLRRMNSVLTAIRSKPVASRLGWRLGMRAGTVALAVVVLLIIGAVQIPIRLTPPGSTSPLTASLADHSSPTPIQPSPAQPSPSLAPQTIQKPSPPAAAPPPPPVDPCPTGGTGALAYISNGNVVYRNSPSSESAMLDGSGRADDLRWTPNGATLVYKEVAASGSVAGQLRALHPGGGPFWSFGTDILSYDISTDAGSIVALAQHFDTSGNWDNWILYVGPLGGSLTPHVVPALVYPGGPGWNESVGGEPLEEANYVPAPGNYWGVIWYGSTIYVAEAGNYATFDASGNQTAGYAAQSGGYKALMASIGQPGGSAVHFSQRGVNLTSTCAGSTRAVVAPPNFTQYSSNTLMLYDDPINPRAGLAIESYNGATGGDVYLVTADRQATALTQDHHSFLALWRP